MSRVIKKQLKLPDGINGKDLSDLFNQMLGASSPPITIAYPRYLRIKDLVDKLIKIIDMFNNSPYMKSHTELATYRVEIEVFCNKAEKTFEEAFNYDFSRYELNLDAIPDDLKGEFIQKYLEIKKSNFINMFIIMCDRLLTYNRYLRDPNNLDGKFIGAIPGVEFAPFPFTTFNLKLAYHLDGISELSQRFIVNVLHKLFKFSHELYKEITSPDVNVDEIAEIILSNLDQIRGIPELSRCGRAFDRITSAIDLLKDNFGEYYRDFISTKNSSIMMENFILDVAKNTQADVEIRRQFMTIIKYYRKMAGSMKHDPSTEMLFNSLNETLNTMERGTTNLVNIKKYENEGENN
jgi:hypothetical protein